MSSPVRRRPRSLVAGIAITLLLTLAAGTSQAQQSPAEVKRGKAGEQIGRELRKLATAGGSFEAQRALLASGLRAQKVPRRTVDALLDYGKPGVALRPTKIVRRSRYGGPALDVPGSTWPTNERSGRPLSLLATMDLAELRAPAPLPPDGTLALYYDTSAFAEDEEYTEDWLDLPAAAEVRWFPAGTTLDEIRAPKRSKRYPLQYVAGLPILIVGGWTDSNLGGREASAWRAYDVMSGIAWRAYRTIDQLGGGSQDIQGPVLGEIPYWFKETTNAAGRAKYTKDERAGRGWTLLAQVSGFGSDDMMFADLGSISFAVPTADLTARRFDRAIAIFQTG